MDRQLRTAPAQRRVGTDLRDLRWRSAACSPRMHRPSLERGRAATRCRTASKLVGLKPKIRKGAQRAAGTGCGKTQFLVIPNTKWRNPYCVEALWAPTHKP